MFIDVNLGEGNKPRITLYNGDKPEDVASRFARKHSNSYSRLITTIDLDFQMKNKLVQLLKE